jgi:GAF domain-containing protein
VRAHVNTRDEVGILADQFNRMAAQISSLIGNLEQRVTDRTRALYTSTEVSRRLSTILDRDQLVKEVVDQLQKAFNYYHVHIYLLDEAGENMVMVGGTGEAGRAMLANGHKVPRGRGLVGQAAETGKPILVGNVTSSPTWLPNPLLPNTKSELAVPIMSGESIFGVLDVQQDQIDGLTEEDIDLVQSIANQVAVALQNALRYAETRESERLIRSVIDSTPDWIFIKDQQHRYRLVNQGYANSLHIPVDQFIGKDDLDLGFPENW